MSDFIDEACLLQAGEPVHALRRRREKVLTGSQQALHALLDPALPGLTLAERLLVAVYACQLSDAEDAAALYRTRLQALPDTTRHLDASGRMLPPEDVADPRLRALLAYARTLILRPIEGDRAALDALRAAGLDSAEIVTLSQLIGFLSYQVRVVAGLRAMAPSEVGA